MIYLDSCILIYAIEDRTDRGDVVRRRLDATEDVLAASPLVLHECLVGPLRAQDMELRDRYRSVLERLRTIDLTTQVFVRAAELRAGYNLKTPDALHLAAAQLAGCTQLWTNDTRLANVSRGLAVDVLA